MTIHCLRSLAMDYRSWFLTLLLIHLMPLPVFSATPANDAFANRRILIGTNLVIELNAGGATRETSEPAHTSFPQPPASNSVWFEWTAPQNGTLLHSTRGSVAVAAGSIAYSGASVSSLATRGTLSNPFGMDVAVSVSAGARYAIAVVDRFASGDPIRLSLLFLPAPSNDAFINRVHLPTVAREVKGWIYGGTREAFEGTGVYGSSVWYEWIAPQNGRATIRFRLTDRANRTAVAVFRGTSMFSLTRLWPDTYGNEWFPVTAGDAYQIALSGDGYLTGLFDFDVTLNTAAFTSPITEQSFVEGATVPVQITTSAYDGTIARVNVFTNGSFFASRAETPYEFLLTNAPIGHLTLSAETVDPTGVTNPVSPISFHVRASNDDFANRIVVTESNIVLRGLLDSSTREPGEPLHATHGVSGSLWWTWTAPLDAIIEIKQSSETNAFVLAQVAAVYRGQTLATLEEVASNSGIWREAIQFKAKAGETYVIAASDIEGLARRVALSIQSFSVPPNDDFAGRLPLAVGQRIEAVNSEATSEPGEPLDQFTLNKSLWWTWTAPSNGAVSISPDEWTSVRFFFGNEPTNLAPLAEDRHTIFGEKVYAGEVIQMRVDEGKRPSDPPEHHLGFTLHFTPAAWNDGFRERIILNGLPVESAGTTVLATSETNENASHGAHSVWHQWTAPQTGPVSLWVDAGFSTPVAMIYTGTNLGSLKQMKGIAYPDSPLGFTARRGQTYLIRVASDIAMGEFKLRILPPPPNDQFENAIELTGILAEAESYTTGASSETGEPRLRSSTRDSIWWTWRAPVSGLVVLRMEANYLVPLGVFTGNSPQRLHSIVSESAPSPISGTFAATFQCASGTVYRIMATGTRDYSIEGGVLNRNGRIRFQLAASSLKIVSPSAGGAFPLAAPISGRVVAAFPDQVNAGVNVGAFSGSAIEVQRATASAPDYTFTLTNVPSGTFQLVATATNASGEPIFSAPIPIRVSPSNDDFANAFEISTWPASLLGSLDGASRQAQEPPLPSNHVSLWWKWTAPTNGVVRIVNPAGIQIFQGSQLASLRRIASSAASFRASTGKTYFIRASGPGSSSCYSALAWLPENDNFARRVILDGTNLTVSADNNGATTERGEPSPGKWVGSRSLWWSWTAPADGTLLLARDNPAATTFLAVFRGSSFADMQLIAADDTEDSPPMVMRVTAGVTYQIALHSPSVSLVQATTAFRLLFASNSANDNFADAAQLTGAQATFGGANYNATREAEEPARSVGNNAVNASLWWKWTATHSGVATITTTVRDVPMFAEVFEGPTLGSLTSLMSHITYFQVPDEFTFQATESHQYFISVGSAGSERGTFQMELKEATAPPNDNFDFATLVNGAQARLEGTVRNATREPDEPEHGNGYGTVWFRWTAPYTGHVLIESSGGYASSVYRGTNIAELTPMAQQGFGQYLPEFRADAGVTYSIAFVSLWNGGFSVPMTLHASPVNDDFSFATELTGSLVDFAGNSEGATAEVGEGINSIWWKWRAPSSGRARIYLLNEPSNLSFGVLRGPDVLHLGAVPTERQPDYGYAFEVQNGLLYRFRVASYPGTVAFQLAHQPNNPVALATRTSVDGSNFMFTIHGGVDRFVAVEHSTDLEAWEEITLVRLGTDDQTMIYPAIEERQFFRVVER